MEASSPLPDAPFQGAQTLARRSRLPFQLFIFTIVITLLWAWLVRDYRYLHAESGLGYWLGIVGGSLMLVLLLYPLGKRWRPLQRLMKLRYWFRLHMLLGVLGPVCILLHSNFNLGSTNSTVALVAMLLVSGSGLIGRYFYGKFHHGLYGAQVELRQLRQELDGVYGQLPHSKGVDALYRGCCDIIASQQGDVSYRKLLSQRFWLRRMKRQARRVARGSNSEQAFADHYRELADVLDKLASVRLFERLFALWHVAHIPVFFLMVVTAIVHVFVVHWY